MVEGLDAALLARGCLTRGVESQMRRVHLGLGLIFVAVFVSGIFMRVRFPGGYQGDQTMRMLFRSAHIYILLAALMNVMVGLSQLSRRRREFIVHMPSWAPCLRLSGRFFI